MTEKELMRIANGSDVRGVAIEGVPNEPVTLTPEAANIIAASFVTFLAKKTGKAVSDLKIAIGHDSRLSADSLKTAALKGLLSTGVKAYDCGLASTPSMFMSTVFESTDMDGSIMITASHLPYNRNGLKFFTKEGGAEHEDIHEILEGAVSLTEAEADVTKAEKIALIDIYAKHLCEKIRSEIKAENYDEPLAGMHIVVDAGNGAGGFFADKVLVPLGANIEGSQFLNPDGNFPNHIPNPEDKNAMAAIKKAVLDSKADLGLIFDTDVDRMSAVLPDGEDISRNALIAMMAAILAPAYPGSTIITDSVTSDGLAEFLEKKLALKHHRFQRGYKNVINECIRLNKAGTVSPLAIETSGHGALSENYYLDDGAYLAVKLLIAAAKARTEGKQLSSLIEGLKYPAEEKEVRLLIEGVEDFRSYGDEVLKEFEKRANEKGYKQTVPSFEGIRLVFPGEGWLLIRKSLHDPNMPINMESEEAGGCAKLADKARELLQGFEHLNISRL